jgi:predicted aldo/keto reductase-like oxidoreductase
VGSYTASGTGPTGGNLAAIQAAQKQDMGVFIISPTDKGGALYEPSKALYKVTVS